ncbi:MAG: hypothetical protein WEE89_10290 [Gemmatimonadota bacterium]
MSAIKRFSIMSALWLSASGVAAQAPPAGPPPGMPARPVADPKLVFDREVFAYPAQGRRDPFVPLQGTDAMGPLFEDLTLRTIAWSPTPQRSLVLIHDANKKSYLKRLGDVIGNARIIGIEKDRVRFAVQSYGILREEVLIKAPRASVAEIRAAMEAEAGASRDRQFQEQLIRMLRGDTARAAPPATRPDTTRRTTPPTGRTPPVRRDTMESTR